MFRSIIVALLLGIALLIAPAVLAHDSWISRSEFKSAAGEWCCGEGDCFVVNGVTTSSVGYVIPGNGEVVPFSEAQPNPDGAYWRCKRPDGARRCFFAPPPNT
jgi:hypothetical protein